MNTLAAGLTAHPATDADRPLIAARIDAEIRSSTAAATLPPPQRGAARVGWSEHDGTALVADSGGEMAGFAALVPAVHPIDESSEGVLYALHVADRLRGRGIGSELLAAATSWARGCGWSGLRARSPVPGGWLARQPGWELVAIEVARDLGEEAALAPLPAGVELASARTDDAPVVLAMLANALWEGLGSEAARFSREQVAAAALRLFSPLDRPGRATIVARVGGRVVGHATVALDSRDEHAGFRRAHLYDAFVAPDWAGNGLGAALSAGAQRLARGAGLDVISGTVAAPGRVARERILAAVGRDGWRPTAALLRAPLDAGGPASRRGRERCR